MKQIPKSLREERIWYVTEHPSESAESASFPVKRRLSPITLSTLRYEVPTDYGDFATAAEAVSEHPHWFDGCGIRVSAPWLVVVVQYSLQPSGRVYEVIRDLTKAVGGYWELAPRDGDIWTFCIHLGQLSRKVDGIGDIGSLSTAAPCAI